MHEKKLNFKQEIDVRGMRGDEALQAVTYFVDDAIQVGAARIRILHGTGTGILRQLIRDYLHTVPGVRQYHDEHSMPASMIPLPGSASHSTMLTLCTHGRSRQTKRRSKNLSTEIVSTGSRLAV